MKRIAIAAAISCAILCGMPAAASPGPAASPPITPIPAPGDRAYPGKIRLSVDATDTVRRIVHVHETVTGITPGTVLLYPKWLPGKHSPEGPIDRLAGIKITAQGAPVAWTRDPIEIYAFHVHAAPGVKAVDIDFDDLSPTSSKVGVEEISRDLLMLQWNALVLYPAGYYARQIPVEASLKLPSGWQFGTALEATGTGGDATAFRRTNLEMLIDSPVYAGRYGRRLDLDPGAAVPVHLNLFADRPELLEVKSEALAAHRSLVQQSYKLFGAHHYSHYDFLYSLSDQIQQHGLEHHQSCELGTDPESFTEWEKTAYVRDLLPHEFTHSWNGKFRRPADLWTPGYEVPMRNSLLWVYEGQTEYWGNVLAGRSGLRTRQQSLEQFAQIAAYYDVQAGRRWRAVLDTTNDEIINPRQPMSWSYWQRYEEYYDEGLLIWLEVDTLIRERSNGQRSLDDFARAFFGIDDGSFTPVTYTFADVIKALNGVEPFDWAGYLGPRIDGVDRPVPLDGMRRGGYRLVYTDKPSDYQAATDTQRKRTDLVYSIGIQIDESGEGGEISDVVWDSPAFKARLTEGAQILAVNGIAYDAGVLEDAVRASQGGNSPLELIVKTGDCYAVVAIDYHGGLRYPHLERDPSVPARLDDILSPRQ